MKEQPSFYAIIPADVRYSDLPPNAKLLYGEITALAEKEGYCWASNAYFAKLYRVRKEAVSEWIGLLKKKGFVGVEIIKRTQRKIIIIGEFRMVKKHHRDGEKTQRGDGEKTQHINTSDSTTVKSAPSGATVGEMIDLFQEVDPNWRRLFARKNQHDAVKRMLGQHGREKLEAVIRFLPRNNAQPYAPKITSPIQLEDSWGKMRAFWDQEKQRSQKNNVVVA